MPIVHSIDYTDYICKFKKNFHLTIKRVKMRLKKNILLCFLLMGAVCLHIQGSTSRIGVDSLGARKQYVVHFRFDEALLDSTYMDNRVSLNALNEHINDIGIEQIDSVIVVSQSSPEGVYEHNLKLSRLRAASMRKYFNVTYPDLSEKLLVEDDGEAWAKLREYVLTDSLMKDSTKEQVLKVIDADVNIGTKKWRMEQLPIYRYLRMTYYKRLRHSAICIVVPKPQPEPAIPIDTVSQDLIEDILPQDTIVPEPQDTIVTEPLKLEKKEIFYLRSNLLVPISNFGAEVAVGKHWSIGADYYFPWIKRNPNHKECFQLLGWGVEGRYWFNQHTRDDCLEGHSLGVNVSLGYYDFERSFSGHQGEFINAGVDYLYGLPIFKDRMHLEFSIGLGYIFSQARPYDVFEEGGKAYKKGYKQNIHWLGPQKAGVSLVLPINVKRRVQQ